LDILRRYTRAHPWVRISGPRGARPRGRALHDGT
jgi:hypothetical protein